MPTRDEARWYRIDGAEYPSVTTILSVIAKPALGPWYAKEERRAFETAMLEVAARYQIITADQLLDAVLQAVEGVKAADREKQRAATIGTAAHALIEWHTRRMLGEKVGPEPVVPDAAAWAVEAWKDWAREVDFTPLVVERTVYCPQCGYAGTVDWVGKVRGVLTLGDYKTGRAIYPEALLQNVAYRHAAERSGLPPVEQGVVLRLPKALDDPAFEVMVVPDDIPLGDFLAALRLWRWQRRMSGQPVGTLAPGCEG